MLKVHKMYSYKVYKYKVYKYKVQRYKGHLYKVHRHNVYGYKFTGISEVFRYFFFDDSFLRWAQYRSVLVAHLRYFLKFFLYFFIFCNLICKICTLKCKMILACYIIHVHPIKQSYFYETSFKEFIFWFS